MPVAETSLDTGQAEPGKQRRPYNTDRFEFGRVRIPVPGERARERREATLDHVARHGGLSDADIRELQLKSEKMAKANKVAVAPVYMMQTLKHLADLGLVHVSTEQILSLVKTTGAVPEPLLIAIVTFLAKHLPLQNDFAGIQEFLKRGLVLGIGGLVELHRYQKDKRQRQRKKAGLVKPKTATATPAPERPKLLTAEERAEKQQLQDALHLLPELYKHRHDSRFPAYAADLIECCQSLVDSGYGRLVPSQCREILLLNRKMACW